MPRTSDSAWDDVIARLERTVPSVFDRCDLIHVIAAYGKASALEAIDNLHARLKEHDHA